MRRRRLNKGRTVSLQAKWESILRQIPGYDPIATANGYRFDEDKAQLALDFFSEMCTHVKGPLARKPLTLEPWQKAIIANLFGWIRPDGTRRYRETLIFVPRKNGKSCLMAGLVLYMLFCDGEYGAEIVSAAADRDQAMFVYDQAKGMVLQEPELNRRCRIYRTFKSIEYPETLSVYKAISADADTKHGGNLHCIIMDELHAQKDRELVDVLKTSTGARSQPLTVYITTSDYERPGSICNEIHNYASKVRDGIIEDPHFLPVIYEATKDDDWTSEETWKKANPNYGISVSKDYLAEQCLRAQQIPSYENTFKRLHLNIRTEQDVRWIPLSLWDQEGCQQPFSLDSLAGQDCYAGLDFGWRDDLAALVLVFPQEDDWYLLPFFWVPRNGRRDLRSEPIRTFIAEGLIFVTEGNTTDIDAIYAKLDELRDTYTIKEIAIDPSNARKQGQDLMAEGFEVYEFVQSKRYYNEPCRFFEQLLKDGRLRHGGNKVLRWMASNVMAELDHNEYMMPSKKRSSEKIDGICAAIMGIARGMLSDVAEPEPQVDVW